VFDRDLSRDDGLDAPAGVFGQVDQRPRRIAPDLDARLVKQSLKGIVPQQRQQRHAFGLGEPGMYF